MCCGVVGSAMALSAALGAHSHHRLCFPCCLPPSTLPFPAVASRNISHTVTFLSLLGHQGCWHCRGTEGSTLPCCSPGHSPTQQMQLPGSEPFLLQGASLQLRFSHSKPFISLFSQVSTAPRLLATTPLSGACQGAPGFPKALSILSQAAHVGNIWAGSIPGTLSSARSAAPLSGAPEK